MSSFVVYRMLLTEPMQTPNPFRRARQRRPA